MSGEKLTARDVRDSEMLFFNRLNQIIEPLVRAGFGFPCLSPAGAILLETTGRKSGRVITVPLVATRIGVYLLVSTVRHRSQWVKNVAANPTVRYWMNGRAYEAKAFVFSPFVTNPSFEIPEDIKRFAQLILPQSRLLGMSFAILVPHQG